MALLKQSTVRSRVVLMIDTADHIAGKTGLTLAVKLSKNGAAFATITPTVTELEAGFYSVALTTVHTDTIGDLAIHVTSAGADPTDIIDEVCADILGSWPTSAGIADAVWDEPIAGHLSAGSTGLSLNNATAAGNPWAAVIEGAYTAQDILRILAAVAAGKDSITTLGSGNAIVTFRDITDTSNIVVANMTGSSRSTVTLAP